MELYSVASCSFRAACADGVFINSLQAGSAVDSEEAELQPLNDTQIVLVWLCATTIRCPSEALSKLC